jgi:hypothetical protein
VSCGKDSKKVSADIVEKIATYEKVLFENNNLKNKDKAKLVKNNNSKIENALSPKKDAFTKSFSEGCTQDELTDLIGHYDCLNKLFSEANKESKMLSSTDINKCDATKINSAQKSCREAEDSLSGFLIDLRE